MRNELRIGSDETSDSSLKSVWAALDNDGSGYITAGEYRLGFGLGAANLNPNPNSNSNSNPNP